MGQGLMVRAAAEVQREIKMPKRNPVHIGCRKDFRQSEKRLHGFDLRDERPRVVKGVVHPLQAGLPVCFWHHDGLHGQPTQGRDVRFEIGGGDIIIRMMTRDQSRSADLTASRPAVLFFAVTASSRSMITRSAPDASALANRSGRSAGTKR